MHTYPVKVHAVRPETFDRVQLLLRLLILAVPSMLGISAWPFGALYLGLPLIAAVLLTNDPERFPTPHTLRLASALSWVFELFAYLTFVSDRFPRWAPPAPSGLRIDIVPRGTPTVASALMRLFTSLPSALVLVVCSMVSCLFTTVAAVCVFVSGSYPRVLWGFQLAVLRWHVRLFTYHASLIDAYPPFALDTSPDEDAPPSSPIAVQH